MAAASHEPVATSTTGLAAIADPPADLLHRRPRHRPAAGSSLVGAGRGHRAGGGARLLAAVPGAAFPRLAQAAALGGRPGPVGGAGNTDPSSPDREPD